MMIPDEQIFFFLGFQKSGTSWVAALLRAHPEVHCEGEGHFHRGDDDRLYLPDALAASEPFRRWAESHSNLWNAGRKLDEDAEFFAAAITRAILARAARASRKRLVGDKSGVSGPGSVASLARMFPGARILHIIRDPRDVAVSKCFHLWRGVAEGRHALPAEEDAVRLAYVANPEEFGAGKRSIFHPHFLHGFAEQWAAWIPGCRELARTLFRERYLEMTYEALWSSPHAELTRIFDFLAVSAASNLVDACIDAASFERQSGRPPGRAEPTSYFRRGGVEDWRNYFTPEDVRQFEVWLGPALTAAGYATTSAGEPCGPRRT